MFEAFLSLVFAVHAAAFGYFYVARERKLYNLLFLPGFTLLMAHYGREAWAELTGDGGSGWPWVRYTGLAVVAVAALLLVSSRLRRRGRPPGAGA